MLKKIKHKILRKIQVGLKGLDHNFPTYLDEKAKIHSTVQIGGGEFRGSITAEQNSSLKYAKISGKVSIQKNCQCDNSIIAGEINIGNNCKIIDKVALYGNIEVGRYTSINGPNTDLTCAVYPIIIGSFCSIARNVTFQEFNHDFSRMSTYYVNTNLKGNQSKADMISKGAIEIGHDVWIGTHCVILSGAKIGTGSVVAANSVVTGEIPPYAIVAGSPAKVIKYRFSAKIIDQLLASEWWNKPESEIIVLFNDFNNKYSNLSK